MLAIFLFVCDQVTPVIKIRVVGAAVLAICAGAAVCWLIEYKRLRFAQLIVENKILRIRPVVFGSNPSSDSSIFNSLAPAGEGNMDVFISYFGLLLGRQVIRFAFDGVSLKEVELGRDFIILTYGRGNWAQSMRLLLPAANRDELEIIVDKFRREAGIIPSVISGPAKK